MKESIFVFVGILSLFMFVGGCTSSKQKYAHLDAFAQCLTTKGFIFFGTPTCQYCQKQKSLFGESFQYITYVDCTQTSEKCSKLNKVPTRKISDGTHLEGVQSLEQLAKISNCVLK